MGMKADIIAIIKEAAPGCVAEHDRDGFDKLHDGDLNLIADRIAEYIKKRSKKNR